jgi:hypothetical protein
MKNKNLELASMGIFLYIKSLEENIISMQENINKLYNQLSDLDDAIENQNNIFKGDEITLSKSDYHKIIIHYMMNHFDEGRISRDIERNFCSDWIEDLSFSINYNNQIELDSCQLELSNFDIQDSILSNIEIDDEFINIKLTEESE